MTGDTKNLNQVNAYLNKIKPAHLTAEVVYGGNRHRSLNAFTHEELGEYTNHLLETGNLTNLREPQQESEG